ncbi:MAG: hypothetical protein V4733_07715 [Verrucomicrobiota bacterium]
MKLIPRVYLLLSSVSLALPVGNDFISRDITTEGGVLKTTAIHNKEARKTQAVTDAGEFAVIFHTAADAAPRTVTAADFKASSPVGAQKGKEVILENPAQPLRIKVRYWSEPGQPWTRKQLVIHATSDIVIDEVKVEKLGISSAFEPYHADQMTAVGVAQWRPPLGQPVYTKDSALWMGLEFPAARNRVKDGEYTSRHLTAKAIAKGETWASHVAVIGTADDAVFVKDAFFDYLDRTRIRPLRLRTQYNSWFDFDTAVNSQKFIETARKVNDELVVKRGAPPLSAYVIDDGWQDNKADWSKTGVWPVNNKFQADFKNVFAFAKDAKSHLGLWVSPGCLFGSAPSIPAMKAAGWKTLDPWMSMTGPAYMDALEKRLIELTGMGFSFYKFDGVFGHLNQRNFDIPGFKGGEKALDQPQYDDAKERYLALGSERLIKTFHALHKANPNVYLVISNGAFLSPWWLQHVDTVWMINAGDAADGADRTGELVYRDAVYQQLAAETKDNTQFPIHSIFNHEPKKTTTGESADEFRRYLYMNVSRGTGFVEMYLKTPQLSAVDWDVLAEGLKWAHHVFPTFKRARMFGDDPTKGGIYGFTGWTDSRGYISLHNPSAEEKTITLKLDRAFGLTKKSMAGKAKWKLSSPLAGDAGGLPATPASGDEITVKLPPKAIRILEFSRVK